MTTGTIIRNSLSPLIAANRRSYAHDAARPGATTNDADQVRLAATGDHSAFAYLFESRIGRVSKYVQAIVGNKAVAEDVASDVFITVWKRIGQLRDPEKFDGWVFRLAHNQSIDALRRYKKSVPLDDVTAENQKDSDPMNDPETSLEMATSEVAMRSLLLSLPDDQREVLTLRFLWGMSHGEIGVQMNKRADAIRALQYRALQALRSRLAP